jgi:hypothetical protein
MTAIIKRNANKSNAGAEASSDHTATITTGRVIASITVKKESNTLFF